MARLYDELMYAAMTPARLTEHTLGGPTARAAIARRLLPAVRRAVAFRVGDDVVEAAVRLAHDHPDVLADFSRRARLPFDAVFLEWDNRLARTLAAGAFLTGAPDRVGALCESVGDAVFEVTPISPDGDGEPGRRKVGANAFAFRFSPDADLGAHGGAAFAYLRGFDPALSKFYWASFHEPHYRHEAVLPFMFGSAPWQRAENPAELEAGRSMSRRTSIVFNRFEGDRFADALLDATPFTVREPLWSGGAVKRTTRAAATRKMVTTGYTENLGFGKLVVSILSLLNAKDRLVTVGDPEAPAGRFYTGSGFRRYEVHRTVTLRLPLERSLRVARAVAFGIRRRRHPVMGHWCSSSLRGDPGHAHEYADVSPRLKECACGHRCWWREPCERGDASLGRIVKDYELRRRAA